MKYEDKLFIVLMVIYIFSSNDVLCSLLALILCFVSLEYPLKRRRVYFWILIVYSMIMVVVGCIVGALMVHIYNEASLNSTAYISMIQHVALILSLYYRDNEDFILREKVKELVRKKSMDKDMSD